MKYIREIVSVTSLTVSADLENGFGDNPAAVADTLPEGAATGILGGSIEEATCCPDQAGYAVELATEHSHHGKQNIMQGTDTHCPIVRPPSHPPTGYGPVQQIDQPKPACARCRQY